MVYRIGIVSYRVCDDLRTVQFTKGEQIRGGGTKYYTNLFGNGAVLFANTFLYAHIARKSTADRLFLSVGESSTVCLAIRLYNAYFGATL